MKKLVYRLLIVVFFLSLNGCEAILWVIGALMGYTHGVIPVESDGKTGNNVFQVMVGEEGKIFTSDGFGPAEWVERQSGTIEKLNFVTSWRYSIIPDAFAIGDNGTVLYSPQRGYNWQNWSIPSFNKNLYGCDLFEAATVPGIVACGDEGIICISTDGGSDWSQHNTITNNKLNSIMAYGGDNFVAVGDNGTIIKGDPQYGWSNKSVDPNVNLYRVFQGVDLSWSKIWAVGSNGKIYYSSDYGNSWGQQNSGTTADLYDVKFRNSNDGMVVGASGVVRYTTNGGLNWLSDPYFDGLTDGDIYSISVIDTNISTAVIRNYSESAGNETLLLTVSLEPLVSVDNNNNQIPSEYLLEQNFPNPFNPSTTIQFSIPEQSFVRLEVFNTLGEKVKTLVSEELKAGNYKYEWNAENLSSGIYLYKISAKNFSQSKKMILLK